MVAMAKKAKQADAAAGGEPERKRRTWEHEIADLSVNFVERLALKCGCVVQRPAPDYGYDLRLETFNDQGEVEDEQVSLQLKATDGIHLYVLATEECFSFPIHVKDYRLWKDALMPVFLILYDAQLEEAYWLHVQDYEDSHKPEIKGDTLRLHLPRHHVVGVQTIRMMRQRKNERAAELRRSLTKETKHE
jgi:hypothetical protein